MAELNQNQQVETTKVEAGSTVPADGNDAYIAATAQDKQPAQGLHFTIGQPVLTGKTQQYKQFLEAASEIKEEYIKDKQEQFFQILKPSKQIYNNSAYIPTNANFSTTGAGELGPNGQNTNDISNLWDNYYVWNAPDCNVSALPTNKSWAALTYTVGEFQDILKSNELIEESKNKLRNMIALEKAYGVYFGWDKLTFGQTVHYDGKKDIISVCKATTAQNHYDDTVDLQSDSVKYNYIDLDNTTDNFTNEQKMAQFKAIIEAAGYTNKIFGFKHADDTNNYYTNEEAEVQVECWPQYMQELEMNGINYYQQLKAYFDTGTMKKLARSGCNVAHVDGSTIAQPVNISPTTLGLGEHEFLITDKKGFIGRKWAAFERDWNQEYTTNNDIEKVQTQVLQVTDYLNAHVAIVVKMTIDLTQQQTPNN